jgi:membrane-associated protein
VNVLDPHGLLDHGGALAIFLILLAETGLLIGVVLPGDSLLFTAGLLSATTGAGPHLSLPLVLLAAAAGALLGAQIGYLIGRKAGSSLLDPARRPKLQDATARTDGWLTRYGPAKAVVLARFVPVVRTLINPIAGIVAVPARSFTIAQVGGGLVWTTGIVLAGYWLGSHIPNIDSYLLPIIAFIVTLSLLPVALELVRSRRARTRGDSLHPRQPATTDRASGAKSTGTPPTDRQAGQ